MQGYYGTKHFKLHKNLQMTLNSTDSKQNFS